MKKLLSLLALFIIAMGVMAQTGWTNTHTDAAQDRTVIYADFSVVNGDATYAGNWTIGVFVGDECRLVAQDNNESVLQTFANTHFLKLEVPGNYGTESDLNKDITIKVANSMAAIYTITPSETLKYDPTVTYGTQPSGPRVQLTLTLPSSISLTTFATEAGNTVDLTNFVSPDGAVLPDNAKWVIGARNDNTDYSAYATVSGSELTAIKPYFVNGVNTYIPYGVVIDGGNNVPLCEFSQFLIDRTPTAISIVTNEFTVDIDDATTLTRFMDNNFWDAQQNQLKAYTYEPDDMTFPVKWEVSSEYVTYDEGTNKYTPVKGGTTQIRPYFKIGDQYLYPQNPQWITLNIHVPVTGLTTTWPTDANGYVSLKANVGDDITEIYNATSGEDKLFTVLPTGATDKMVLLGYADLSQVDEGVLEWDGYGHGVAAKAGTVTLRFKSRDNESIYQDILVEVFNPATAIDATEGKTATSPLIIDKSTAIATAAQTIAGNITYTPAGSTPTGTISSTGVIVGTGGLSANGTYFNITNPTDALVAGEATVTASLQWNDYSAYVGTNASIQQQSASVTFYVKVTEGLDHFDITITPNAEDPTRGTITLAPVPSDAVYNLDDYNFNLAYNPNPYGTWNLLTFARNAENPLQWGYVAELPGTLRFYVNKGNVNHQTETTAIPAKVSFAQGWQWKSNPYGVVAASSEALSLLFGKDLVEARTQSDLLYNDSEWGYWGSMLTTGIGQSEMYKVKMSAAKTSYLTGGTLKSGSGNIAIELAPGWNWIGSPYFYDRLVNNIFTSGELQSGCVIVTKTGSVEWGKGWSDDLVLRKGEGFLVYNSASAATTCHIPVEVGRMNQGDETLPAGARGQRASVWQYDHTQFASNMTMVVEMPELENAGQYTIGAFVDGECRGEGHFKNGLAFITVHTDGGERVSFMLHNELTGQYTDIEETVTSQLRVGSLKAPFRMTPTDVVTGINNVNADVNLNKVYDLGGRLVRGQQKGVSIVRQKDGSTRKVVR